METEVKHTAKTLEVAPIVNISEVKLKQSVLNLDTNKDEDIEFKQSRYTVRDFDPKTDGDIATFTKKVLSEVSKLVQPVENQIQALLNYATSQSYQTGRAAALAGGKYLTQELRSKIVVFMRAQPQFSDLSAKDAFARWQEGFVAKKAGAIKILAIVSADSNEFSDL